MGSLITMEHSLKPRPLIIVLVLFAMATPKEVKVFRHEEEGTKLVSAANNFALTLYSRLGEEKAGKNLFFSPLSISFALGMTYLGARGNTAQEVAEVMKFSEVDPDHLHTSLADLQDRLKPQEGDFVLHTANRLFGQQGFSFLDSFVEATKTHYGAEIQAVDFVAASEAVRQEINTWVEDQTNKKITDLIPSGALNSLTRLVLVNAIYFKGDWLSKFDKEHTKDEAFYLDDSQSVTVPMMTQTEKFGFGYSRELEAKALELPYKGDKLSMVLILPDSRSGLAKLESSLTAQQLSQVGQTFRMHPIKTVVSLPKFKLEASFDMADTFIQLGMKDLFDMGRADLSGVSGGRDLFVSKIVHKAFLNVDEEGSEAAAATGVVMMMRSMPRIMEFRADHPFMLMIRENRTGSILFMGRLVLPAASDNSGDKSEL